MIRPWGTAIAVYVLGGVLTAYAAAASRPQAGRITDGAGPLWWAGVPSFLVFVLMTVLAAAAQPAADRGHDRRLAGRHALAVLTVPALLVLVVAAFGLLGNASALTTVVTMVASAAGAAAGWWPVARWRYAGHGGGGSLRR